MSSWRETASDQAQADLDGLLNVSLELAEGALARRGEIQPVAFVRPIAGPDELVMADLGASSLSSSDLILQLIRTVSSLRDGLRAAAFVADVHLAERNTDAVRVILEHREGPVLAVLMPYSRRRRGLEFGALDAVAASAFIW